VGWKFFGGFATDPLSWRIGRDQFRMLGLKLFQPAEQLIEFVVGDRRLIENVILILVFPDLFSEVFNLAADGLLRHDSIHRTSGTMG